MAFHPLTPAALRALGSGPEELWLFAYGSLLFRPGFAPAGQERARAFGFRRAFTQSSTDHRGTKEKPGRVVTLLPEENSVTEGLALRLPPEGRAALLDALVSREQQGYEPGWLDLALRGERPLRALCFIAPPDNPWSAPELPLPELAAHLQECEGPSGHNLEYVLALAETLLSHELEDEQVFQLANLLMDPEATLLSDEQEDEPA